MRLLYITCGSEEEAVKIAQILLSEKLIACANIIAGSTSIYKWQGEVKQHKEAIMFAKTTLKNTKSAIERAQKLHSYELPCILVLPVEGGLPEFIDWVKNEVANVPA